MQADAGSTEVTGWFSRPKIRGAALEAYRQERLWNLTANVAFAVVGGGFAGVVAAKVFAAHPAVIAALSAAPMFANLSGVGWSRLAHGRRKVPFIAAMTAAGALLAIAVGTAPVGPIGVAVLVACVVLSNLMLSGIIALRSTIWSLNYSRAVRARVTARLQLITMAVLVATSFAGSRLLDWDPASFRAIFIAAGLVGAFGVLAAARIPVVGEDDHLSLERGEHADAAGRSRHTSMLTLLREDPAYARYQLWQFMLGFSNMMIEAPLVILVSREMDASYVVSVGLVVVVPMALSGLSLPFWAHYLDRVHIVAFRSRTSLLWTSSQALTWLGAFEQSLAILLVARLINGFARGSGSLAWNLGHNDFAPQRDLAAYMALHVTLTGARGLVAPFLAVALAVGWGATRIPGTGLVLPGFAGIGSEVFLVCVTLSTIAGLGYLQLRRRLGAG